MTKLLEQAIDKVSRLDAERQDDIARAMLALAGELDAQPMPLTADERAAIARSRDVADRGEYASEDEVRALWAGT